MVIVELPASKTRINKAGDVLRRAASGEVVEPASIEDELGPQGKYEIVLVGADSLETIKRTHSPYFSTGTTREIVDDFIASIR